MPGLGTRHLPHPGGRPHTSRCMLTGARMKLVRQVRQSDCDSCIEDYYRDREHQLSQPPPRVDPRLQSRLL